jgi:hypothetical protein
MGNKTMSKRSSARRAATFLAVIGALIMSSGVALMVSATPANAAADKWFVCKYVTTPGGDEVLQTGNNPISVNSTALDGTPAPGAFIPFKDGHTLSYVIEADTGQEEPDVSECPLSPPETPTCPEGTDHAGEEIPEGSTEEEFCNDVIVTPPTVCPEGTDNAGQEVPEGSTIEDFCDEVVVVNPPEDNPPAVEPPAVTPTVVHAGLAGVSADDMRGEQGLALMFAGMVMLLGAGGLGLRVRGNASRI